MSRRQLELLNDKDFVRSLKKTSNDIYLIEENKDKRS